MLRRKSSSRAFAVHPAFSAKSTSTVREQFLSGDIVADEIDERTFHSRNHLLKRFEHECVDQEMVYGREVSAQCHIIEVRVSFWRSQRRVDQFLVVARQRNVPASKLLLQRAELAACQRMAKSTRTAMRKKAYTAV